MNTTTEHRSPDEIEREIKHTQDDMSRTVDRLGDQFTMRNLFGALFDKAEQNDIEARRIYDSARRNPLALGLLSAGAIWLVSDYDAHPRAFTSSGSDNNEADEDALPLDRDHEREHRSYVEHMASVERRDGEDNFAYQRRRNDARATFLMVERRHDEDETTFSDRLEQATNDLRQKRDAMAEGAKRRRDEALDRARDAKSKVSAKSRRGVQRVSEMYDDNPLIGGAMAALLGLVAGSATPATRMERDAFGDHAEGALETAKGKAQSAAETAQHKKDEAVAKAETEMTA
ncbi:MAG: DUF3618 domain-containing protein [Erythrobacter sp.]|jgi:ElaB/YqjD/DUF883 family membrane-anchored ribosome-binding protein|nr:DUF3618 domain-containing protein [Erythrobacter sp.]